MGGLTLLHYRPARVKCVTMLKEIPIELLTPGMFVESCGDGSFQLPFQNIREYVHTRDFIEDLKAQGLKTVTIDDSKTMPSAPGASDGPSPGRNKGKEGESRAVYNKCVSHVSDVLNKVRQGLAVDFTQSYEAVDALMGAVEENRDQMVLLSKLQHYDEYTYHHSLNVSLLSMIFGRYLGMDRESLRRLAFAGLYHDVGKFRVPLEILNKPGRLSEREFEVMKRHSLLGYELLRENPAIPEDVLLGVLNHHERFDGKGYPKMLKGEEKDPFSRILTIVDIFDALTSDRAYKKAFTPHESLKSMFSWRNESFHPGLLEKFVECFGVYPPGSFVRLSDGTHGMVVEARPTNPARPLVKVSFSKKLAPQLPRLEDLSLLPKAAGGGLDIEACLDPRTLGIQLERFV